MEHQLWLAEVEEKIKNSILALEIVTVEAIQRNQSEYIFIDGVVRNTGDEEIYARDSFGLISIEIELLDTEERAIASKRTYVSNLKPNFSDKFLVSFDAYQVSDWNGSYRIRIGDSWINFFTDWVNYDK